MAVMARKTIAVVSLFIFCGKGIWIKTISWKRLRRIVKERDQDIQERDGNYGLFSKLIFVNNQLSGRKHEMLMQSMLYGLLAEEHNRDIKYKLRQSNLW